MVKRKIKVSVISDVHLGTYGCQAKALNQYLKSIDPEILILNGDFIDIWQFSKNYWPDSHMKIIQRIFKMMTAGTLVYYLTGNHDEMLRKFTDFKMGRLEVLNKLVLDLDGKKAWIFHGDVFDITMKSSKWLARLGAKGYDFLIVLNSTVNWFSKKLGKDKLSFSKKVKNGIKNAIKFIDDFEQTAIDIGIEKGYDYVICGHIHQPAIRLVKTEKGNITYLNSGDWIENLTALEYLENKWELVYYKEPDNTQQTEDEFTQEDHLNMEYLYKSIVNGTN
ncbi:MAG: metallophosphoesterase family protein [Bacteroidia bacterium]|nr:metallophosphoesterase family protein [Bacteroidia bacterium]